MRVVVCAAFLAGVVHDASGHATPLGQGLVTEEHSFDWRRTDAGNLVGAVRNYLSIPGKACGGIGWSFAATSMVADRIHILQPEEIKVQLSDQTILNCVGAGTSFDGCTNRGTIDLALREIMEQDGIPDRTCMGWRAQKETCSPRNMCVNCLPEKCDVRPTYYKYSITSFGRVDVEDDEAMMNEIRTNGPVACELEDGLFGTLVGYTQVSRQAERDQLNIVPEGLSALDAQQVVYHVKHDLGVSFGKGGFTKQPASALRECWFATPRRPAVFTDKVVQEELAQEKNANTTDNELLLGAAAPATRFEGHLARPQESLRSAHGGRRLQASSAYLPIDQLPETLSWMNKNVLTPVQSHHNGPGYCGACWTLASASAFSDRLKIMSGGAMAPDVFVSPQTSIDCVKPNGCKGGGADEVYPFYQAHGTVDETCNAWVVGEKQCMLNGRGCKQCDANGQCGLADPSSYKVYQAESWGNIQGEEAMMNELQHGPIVCGIATEPGLDEMYFSADGTDVVCEPTAPEKLSIDHDVSVVGYGVTKDGEKYWEIRNSWSTSYGHNGFIKVCRGRNNMLIEQACTWVVPKL